MSGWSNWAGNVVAPEATVVAPSSIDELRDIVVATATAGRQIRVAGTGHSFSPLCQSSGIVIDLSNLRGIEAIDPECGDVTTLSGTKIHELGEPLLAAGRALANQGDIDRQAVAGAVSTGTHGTGRKFGSFSNAVRAIELMTSTGELVTIGPDSPESDRRAAALSLGMLGVMTRVRLSTLPAYRLLEQSRAMTFDECLEAYPEIESTHRNAEFWWIPTLDTAVIKSFKDDRRRAVGRAGARTAARHARPLPEAGARRLELPDLPVGQDDQVRRVRAHPPARERSRRGASDPRAHADQVPRGALGRRIPDVGR